MESPYEDPTPDEFSLVGWPGRYTNVRCCEGISVSFSIPIHSLLYISSSNTSITLAVESDGHLYKSIQKNTLFHCFVLIYEMSPKFSYELYDS